MRSSGKLSLAVLALGCGFATTLFGGDMAPFIKEAQALFEHGDYNASRDLCEVMLQREPKAVAAQEILAKTRRQLQRLSRENWEYGTLLESVNRVEEAKQYWHRASFYVRPGDHYYDWVKERLEHYEGIGATAAVDH